MNLRHLLPALLLIGISVSTAFAQLSTTKLPRQIDYQGVLTDNAGVPRTGEVDITVEFYAEPNGGSALFTEDHPNVELDDQGVFHLVIGAQTLPERQIPATVPFDRAYWLQIIVEGTRMPRTKLNAVPFALRAVTVEYSSPVGSIMAYFGEVNAADPLPDDWLLCDGQVFNTAEYPRLSERLSLMGLPPNQTPDLRGMFLRGSNFNRLGQERTDGSYNDPDAGARKLPNGQTPNGPQRIGSVQGDAVGSHAHSLDVENFPVGSGGTVIDYPVPAGSSSKAIETRATPTPARLETRPRNAYVNWIIKAR